MNRYLLCDIDDASLKEFHTALHTGKGTFFLDIASDGGSSNTMLSFFDLIKSTPRHVVGTAYGRCQSAAVLILAACDRRISTSSTIFMVHEDSYEVDGNHGDARKAVAQHEIEENLWAILMAENTTTGFEAWRSMAKSSSYFGPQNALNYGLIEIIFENKSRHGLE